MKLYFVPGTCSFSPHVVLRELGVPFEIDLVDRKTKVTAAGIDYLTKNPRGYVPALELDDGTVMTEGAVIVQYLADQHPEAGLAPPVGTMARYQLAGWMNYVATELHKSFSPFFSPKSNEEYRQALRDGFATKLRWLDGELATREHLAGPRFSVADAYAYTVIGWFPRGQIDLAPHPHVQAWFERVAARPSVKAALAAEKAAVEAAAAKR